MLKRITKKLFNGFQFLRVIAYRVLSNCRSVNGNPVFTQPALFLGKGEIEFGEKVRLGFFPSPFFFSGYQHIESRTPQSSVKIGDNVMISNSCFICSEGAGIIIENDCLIGYNVQIFDSDFHALKPSGRRSAAPNTAPVNIGKNVFIGAGVIVCKGVSIGENSIIGAGSVVTTSIEANVIAGGNPAVTLRAI